MHGWKSDIVGSAFVITAHNPYGELHSEEFNHKATTQLRNDIEASGASFVVGVGGADGHSEDSFLVWSDDHQYLMTKYHQDCVLLIDADGNCQLEWNSKTKSLN
jgi:hypothetical protein